MRRVLNAQELEAFRRVTLKFQRFFRRSLNGGRHFDFGWRSLLAWHAMKKNAMALRTETRPHMARRPRLAARSDAVDIGRRVETYQSFERRPHGTIGSTSNQLDGLQ
jgi:hypothetical protein